MMKKNKCTLFTIVNNEKVFKEFQKNLEEQKDIEFELIPIWNCNCEYSSARNAYNENLGQANGKYVIFIHPDIRFLTEFDLKNIIKQVDEIGDFGVVGVAGSTNELINGKRILYTNIVHGSKQFSAGTRIFMKKEVQTVDECLFIMKREDLERVKFTEKDGWHLYAVEQCLRMNKLYNKKNYIIPIKIWHMSDGNSLDLSYAKTIKDLIKEYSDYTPIINTTVRKWETRGKKSQINIYFFEVIQKLKKIKVIRNIGKIKRHIRNHIKIIGGQNEK